ncbi:MAG: hypothetical protein KDA37_02175 [Planctomycetales bacterium]|nr:hypothetical protein [Planctomycetales bacterium]
MLSSLMTLVAAVAVTQGAQAPQWESDYGKALKQARSSDRPMLVVLDKPGREVDAKLMSDPNASALKKYDLCHVDVSSKYGKEVAKVFHATSFPFIAVADKEAEVLLHTHSGQISESTWNSTLVKYQTGEKPQRHVAYKPASSTVSTTSYQAPVESYQAPVESYQAPVQEYSAPVYYQNNSYCPNCQKGF